jgi:hypothetical protein
LGRSSSHGNARALFASTLSCIWLGACGSGANAPPVPTPPPVPAKPDVIVTIDGQHHTCIVALSNEAQGSTIACADVTAFVRDELRVPSGAIYDVRTIPEVDKTEIAKVEDALKGAGYRFMAEKRAAPN